MSVRGASEATARSATSWQNCRLNCCGVEIVGDSTITMKNLLDMHANKTTRCSIADVEFAVFHSKHRVVDTPRGKSGARVMKGLVNLGYRLFSEFVGESFQFFRGPEVFIGIRAQVRGAVNKLALSDSREWSTSPRIGSTEIKHSVQGPKSQSEEAAGLGPLDEDVPRGERQLIRMTRS